MAIKNYNVSPYYDDFDQDKNFYRILFKPGVAVQARELTQLQTILQNQIAQFGSHVFEEGSIVIPGQSAVNSRYQYVKLEESYNGVTTDSILPSLVGKTLTGLTTGVKADVINFTESTDTDPPTIYVRYTKSGGQKASKFVDTEVLSDLVSLKTQAIASGATGTGSAFIIEPGVLYTKGTFVSFTKQTEIISKYAVAENVIVGFSVSESTITSQDDTTLLDPAQGSYNYAAPGADRYQISLTLTTRDPAAAEDENFIQLLVIEDGITSFKADRPEYAYLEDTLARRTYDESGNYTVRPYAISLNEHLKDANVFPNGVFEASRGGDESLMLARISPGKSYVLGYEVDNLVTSQIEIEKGRDTRDINNSFVRTNRPNHVLVQNLYGVPNFNDIETVQLYNRLTVTPGSTSGTAVGTARVRGIEYENGTHGLASTTYYMYLFDIQLNDGVTFERDVKQISDGTFTCDVAPVYTQLSGSISGTSGQAIITGIGTRFETELVVGDYIQPSGQSVQYRVDSITNNNEITISGTLSANIDNTIYSRWDTAIVNGNTSLIYRFTHDAIATHSDETYFTRRLYDRTLSSGTTSITANVDEVFTSQSSENYFIAVTSGVSVGTIIDLAGRMTLSGSPSGKILSIDVSDVLNTNDDVTVFTTVAKSTSAADEKVKTLEEDETITKTTELSAQARTISLNKADAWRIKSIEVSLDGFGQPFNASNVEDVTANYDFFNGQTPFFYGISYVKRKASAAIPAGPVRVTFDYFSHGPGDYFSVNSYSDIEYYEIPIVTVGGEQYKLAKCLDFRPRINDLGTSFLGTGSSLTEILDFNNDVLMDYSYYLGRIDKIYVNSEGEILVKRGESEDIPLEPQIPVNGMSLFTLKIPPYTYSTRDVSVTTIDNRRYTMKDIGAFDSRIRNLEYYTALSLLEKDTANLQIKDEFGFDRFKNGFIVDQFTGHKVGDPTRADYTAAVDQTKKELRPITHTKSFDFIEKNQTYADRFNDGYVRTGKFATLPYSERDYLNIDAASQSLNVNPYDVITYRGNIKLTPNKDTWFDVQQLPDISLDNPLDYASLLDDSKIEEPFNSLFGFWRDTWYGNVIDEDINPVSQNADGSSGTLGVVDNGLNDIEKLFLKNNITDRLDISIDGDVAKTRVVAPFMRSKTIYVSASGLKPNTRMYPFFDGYRVDTMCYNIDPTNATSLDFEKINSVAIRNSKSPLYTDDAGDIQFIFYYDSEQLRLQTGQKVFKLSDDASNNDNDAEALCQTTFFSTGEYIVQAEINVPPRDFAADVLAVLPPAEPIVDTPHDTANPEADAANYTFEVNATNQLKTAYTWAAVESFSGGTGFEQGDVIVQRSGTVVPGGYPRTIEITAVLTDGSINGVRIIHPGQYVEGTLTSAGDYIYQSGSNNGVGASYSGATFRPSGTYVETGDTEYSYKQIQVRNIGDSGSNLRIEKSNITWDASSDIDIDIQFPDGANVLNIARGEYGYFNLGVRKHTIGDETFNLRIPTNATTINSAIFVEAVNSGAVVENPGEPTPPPSWVGTQGEVQGFIASVYNHVFGRQPSPVDMELGITVCAQEGVNQTTLQNAYVDLAASPDNSRTIDKSTANADCQKVFSAAYKIGQRGQTLAHNNDLLLGGLYEHFYTVIGDTIGNATTSLEEAITCYVYYLVTHDGTTHGSSYNHGWPQACKSVSVDTFAGYLLGSNIQQCPAAAFNTGIPGLDYVDPLAQSFLITQAIHLTSVNLYFSSKSDTFPVEVQLRRMVNGFPSNQGFIEGSSVSIKPSNIITSTDGSAPTRFTFEHPIYLEPDEYCLVVLSPNTTDYTVFISEVGQTDLVTGKLIEKQPSTGVLFKSQNASTWTPVQTQDLKMRLNRAVFTETTAVIDFIPDTTLVTYSLLDVDPFEVFNASSIMKVYHKNHGLANGSTVRFTGLTDNTYFGIDSDDINYLLITGDEQENEFTVANVTQDTYTVTLGSLASVPTDKARFGGSNIYGTSGAQYDTVKIHSLITQNEEENVSHLIKTTNTGYSIDSTFTSIQTGRDINFNETRLLADNTNKETQLADADSFVYRVSIFTANDRVSPMISLGSSEVSGIFVRNRINDPLPQDALTEETIVIADSNQVTFNEDGKIEFGNAADQALVARAVEGTNIIVSYDSGELSPDNEGTYRIREIAEDGSYLYISGTLVDQSAGPNVTIENESGFIAEEAPQGGSAYSKYITRRIDFVNPSTSLDLRIAASRPSGTDIEFYYKTQTIGDAVSIDDKEFVEMDINTPIAASGGFIDIEHRVDNLPEFSSVIFKIVFKGAATGNTAIIPRCKDLRLLALA